ncbi:putative Melatonin receptor type 1B [Hypsibius exemplaris]|uniref:Melatonin receptor type 1B n=1 Tax=Hypsibius exemplaris TaxID=2072580 RepID=A0A9X6RJA2_HYPEX|nr:putative Melatonin receptor type 1B [Hypsibius exemplaris]
MELFEPDHANLTSLFRPGLSSVPWWIVIPIGAFILLTITANLLVIASFLSEPRLRNHFNLYLLNLAVTDLLVGLIGMPHFAVYTYYGYWPLSQPHCSFWMFFDYLCPPESLWSVLAISVDRVCAVSCPVFYRRHSSSRKSLAVIAVSWVVPVAIITPGFVLTRMETDRRDPYVCDWISTSTSDREAVSALVVLCLGDCVPGLATVLCFVLTTWKMSEMAGKRKQRTSASRLRDSQDRQAFMVQCLLAATVVLTWTPWLVAALRKLVFHIEDGWFYTLSYWATYLISGVNPFLFNAASKEMRNSLQRVLGRSAGCWRDSQSRPCEADYRRGSSRR